MLFCSDWLTTTKGLSFAFQANSPYVNDFTLATLRLHENNFLDGLKRKWWDAANKCPEEEETSKNNINRYQTRLYLSEVSSFNDFIIEGENVSTA